MTDLDSVLKSRYYFAYKGPYSQKLIVFPVVTYGCESWTIKKAVCWKTDAFNCGAGVDPWRARSEQPILKEINPEYSLEGLMLKLKLQYFGTWCEEAIHWKRHWCCARVKAEAEGDNIGWDGLMASLTQWTWVWASSRKWMGKPGILVNGIAVGHN